MNINQYPVSVTTITTFDGDVFIGQVDQIVDSNIYFHDRDRGFLTVPFGACKWIVNTQAQFPPDAVEYRYVDQDMVLGNKTVTITAAGDVAGGDIVKYR